MKTARADKTAADFDRIIERNAPLAPLSSFRIGGVARELYRPVDLDQARELLAAFGETNFRILGGGTNILFASPVIEEPLVVAPGATKWKVVECCDERAVIEAPAGLSLGALVYETAAQGLAGLEVLAGVPGTVGGALAMNAGGKHGTVADKLTSARVLDADGEQTLAASEIKFAYRCSSLRGALITSARFALELCSCEAVLQRAREILTRKRTGQPLGARSAGCVFRNPPGDSAGRLIDSAGLKGTACGGAAVSQVHANFIVNRGGARAEDVLALIDKIRGEVKRRFGIALETEIEIW